MRPRTSAADISVRMYESSHAGPLLVEEGRHGTGGETHLRADSGGVDESGMKAA